MVRFEKDLLSNIKFITIKIYAKFAGVNTCSNIQKKKVLFKIFDRKWACFIYVINNLILINLYLRCFNVYSSN